MRVLYVYDGDWPRGATRVEKETRSLARAGHTVHLVSRNSLNQPRRELNEWMTILRLPAVRPRLLNTALNFPYFFNPVWLAAIHSAGRELDADCIVVADLPLALTAVWAGRMLGIPVHYDMAEVYPEFLRSLWEFDEMGWTDHFVRNPRAAEALERTVFRRVDKIFVVTEESLERCRRLGVPAERLVLVGNTPEDVERLTTPQPLPADLERWRGRPSALFVGILIGDRGVTEAVEAMASVVKEVPDAALIVVGDGPDVPRIRAAIERLRLEEHVALLGWKQHAELAAYYQHADVGLLPFRDGSHVRLTLANKLFDYMAAGLAVVASDLPPMRRILDETGAGVTYPPGDVAALGRAVAELLGDRERRRALGDAGRRAVLEKYRWSVDERRFLEGVVSGTKRA